MMPKSKHEGRHSGKCPGNAGRGSLGAVVCGAFKAFVKKQIRIDIAAGTSIGAVSAAIILGSKSDHPEKDLEDFWMELAESSPSKIPDIFVIDIM
jgi:NTE family protein